MEDFGYFGDEGLTGYEYGLDDYQEFETNEAWLDMRDEGLDEGPFEEYEAEDAWLDSAYEEQFEVDF